MPKHTVNLDALIPREYFSAVSPESQHQGTIKELRLSDLDTGSATFSLLRKPDFQRETSYWEAARVADLVSNFVGGDLIPAIILWRSPESGNVFIIDGAHRLSALMAWVNDDYGDGNQVTRPFFGHYIPPEQEEAAIKARELVKQNVGAYRDLVNAVLNQSKADPELVKRGKSAQVFTVSLQWVTGDAQKAEQSFFRINQKAVIIDTVERQILKSRLRPSAIAARAILRGGRGHKFWGHFPDKDKQADVEKIADQIHSSLFSPPLPSVVKSLDDLPIGGRGYSGQSLPTIFELVKLSTGTGDNDEEADDQIGDLTIESLKKTRSIMWRIAGSHASSLGLHPAVYFYSATGRHQPTALLAVVSLIRDFEKRNYFKTFTKHRKAFEDFLIANKHFVNQIVLKFGSKQKSYSYVLEFYQLVLHALVAGKNHDQVLDLIRSHERLNFIKTEIPVPAETKKGKFSSDTKTATFLAKAQKNVLPCEFCGAWLPKTSISFDHIEPQRKEGKGTQSNAQLVHPYCNSLRDELDTKNAPKGPQ
jgi:hypothetical protein